MGFDSGRDVDLMRSPWNHCAPYALNFLHIGGVDLWMVIQPERVLKTSALSYIT
jgi:hypothetical protein